jgi:hypothetical protein
MARRARRSSKGQSTAGAAVVDETPTSAPEPVKRGTPVKPGLRRPKGKASDADAQGDLSDAVYSRRRTPALDRELANREYWERRAQEQHDRRVHDERRELRSQ